MGIGIQYLGRVARAEIECEGITVVAGANGSGKSTVSKSIYALQESFYELKNRAALQRRRSITKLLVEWQQGREEFAGLEVNDKWTMRKEMRILFLNKMEREDFFRKISEILVSYGVEECGGDEIGVLYEGYQEIREKGLKYYEEYVIQTVWERIFKNQANTFGEEENAHVIYSFDDSKLSVEIKDEQVIDFIYKESSLAQMEKTIYIPTSDVIDSLGSYRKGISSGRTRDNAYANEDLVSMLIEEKEPQDWTAEEKEEIRKQKGVLRDILDVIVDGNIQTKEGRLTYFENWCNHEVEFSNIASGMKIFIILKRLLENGVFLETSFVIIDEPETNLHPAWQLKLAELLVLLQCRLGIRIYVNSHSPYFVRAVEYYADFYGALDVCRFYFMKPVEQKGLYESEDVTETLGVVYDQLAEPFNQIM